MTPAERNQVGQAWTQAAQLYGKQLPLGVLKLMLDSIADCPAHLVLQFLENWPAKAKAERHPYPHEVYSSIYPEPDTSMVATALARKIDTAIRRHGWVWEGGYAHSKGGHYWEAHHDGKPNTYHWSFKDAVIAELGEIGWHTICARGGWQAIHASQREMPEGQFIAQLRDQVQSSYALAKQGVDVSLIALPDPTRNGAAPGILELIDSNKPRTQ